MNVAILRLGLCAGLMAGLLDPGPAWAELLEETAPLDELIAALESDDINAWNRGIDFLGRRGAAAKPAVPALIRILDQQSQGRRESALHALKGIGPAAAEAVPVLLRGLARWHDHSAGRWSAAETLAAIGPAATPALREATAGSNPIVAIWAHAALAKQMAADGSAGAPTEHLSFLVRLLRSGLPRCPAEALRAIQMLGPVSAPLIPDLQAARTAGIISAKDLVESLHAIGPAGDIIESILPALESTDEFTRMRGAQTLARIGSPRDQAALPALFAMLESPRAADPFAETMRGAALDALGRIAPNDARMRPLLLKLANDSAARLNQRATKFLLFRQRPIDDEIIAFFVEYVRAHAESLETLSRQGGWSQVDPGDFLALLTPANRGSAPRFEELTRDFAGRLGIMQIGYLALDRMDALKAEHALPLATSLSADSLQGYWAVGPLVHLGPRAAAAVPEMIRLLDHPAPFASTAARILEAIGQPAAAPAIGPLTRLAASVPHFDPGTDHSICAGLLALSPESATALSGLERLLAANNDNYIIPSAHYLLMTHQRNPARHRIALEALLESPDERLVAQTAELLMKPEAPAPMRRRAFQQIIALQTSITADEWAKATSARGLENLSAQDQNCEEQLVAVARRQWDEVKLRAETGSMIPAYHGYGFRQLVSIARGLKNLQPKTPAGRALLAELSQTDIPALLQAVDGNPATAD